MYIVSKTLQKSIDSMYMNTAEEKVSQKIYNNTKYFGLNYKTMYYLYEKHQKFIKKKLKRSLE